MNHTLLYQTDYVQQKVKRYIRNSIGRAKCILWKCKTEISLQNFIHLYTIYLTYFKLLAWKWLSEAETCCQIKDITLANCIDGNLFPSVLYLPQWEDKSKNSLHLLNMKTHCPVHKQPTPLLVLEQTKLLKFLQACECAAFRRSAAIETFVLLECDAASLGCWCLSFRENAVVSNRHAPITDIELNIDAFVDEGITWARKVGPLSPGDAVPKLTETNTWAPQN